jgi:hypothetical protein
MARYISIWRRQRICRENGQGRVYRVQSIWRRQSICRENGEGKLYAEYMEKAEYMQRMTEAGDGNLNQ